MAKVRKNLKAKDDANYFANAQKAFKKAYDSGDFETANSIKNEFDKRSKKSNESWLSNIEDYI